MGAPAYRQNYRAAFEAANFDLDRIFQECDELQLQKERLEAAVRALEPFLRIKGGQTEAHPQETPRMEQVQVEQEVEAQQPVFRAPEPVVTTAFPPLPDAILDPIQNRINRALGLAVA